ncbi:hypothetical protein RBB50_006761 [Rhinocladiella similis]
MLLYSLLFLATRITATVAKTAVSTTGSCGVQSDGDVLTCQDSTFGNCCSTHGFCGSNATYCGGGCQTDYGSCTPSSDLISVDGRCGSSDPSDQICLGSEFGNCCSQNGFCGGNSTYCGTGCQEDFGTCGDSTGDAAATSRGKSTTDTIGFKVGMAIMSVAIVGIIALVTFFVMRRRKAAALARDKQQSTSTSTSTILLEKGTDRKSGEFSSPTSTTRSRFQELDADSTTIQELSTVYNQSADEKKKSMADRAVELE